MFSIIICSIDDRKFSDVSEMYARALPADSFEIVRVADAKSLAEGYNRGIRASRGEHLILCHDDIEILSPDLHARLTAHLGQFDIVGIAGTTKLVQPMWVSSGYPYVFGQVAHPHPEGGFHIDIYAAARRTVPKIQAMDGLFLAMHRRVPQAIPFDQFAFDGFHLYDIDFTYNAYHAGYKLGVCCDIHVLHNSAGQYDDAWQAYAQRFMTKYASRLPTIPPREFLWGWIRVSDKQQLCDVMTPVSWDQTP